VERKGQGGEARLRRREELTGILERTTFTGRMRKRVGNKGEKQIKRENRASPSKSTWEKER